MSSSLEPGEDGSIALYIDNDLQFDSKDEHIYHEGLVLPALALASQRIQAQLNVLIIGGGDGLVARELFKSKQINKVDLVDYDPEILNYARDNFADINKSSLSDPRLSIHIEDAWNFIDKALESNPHYDLIISDLTVPDDAESARFHSIDWYAKLSSLLSPSGVLSINGVSALATPEAFWSVCNSISKGNLHVRPYHVQIPSFTAKGFGADWGFFIASKQPILSQEFETTSSLVEPRNFIKDIAQLLELFVFPKEIFAYQSKSAPAQAGSSILIHYFNSASSYTTSGNTFSSLSFNIDINSIPESDTGKNILPPSLSSALAQMNLSDDADSQLLLEDMLKLMPALQSQCPPELIEEFVQNPTSFLEGIDLQDLVAKLLKRAKELPAQLVTELELLRDKLQEWAGDHLSLMALGQRVITILTLVIIVGNVLYPDSVYGKGEHPAAGAGHHNAAAGNRGNRGNNVGRRGGYVNGAWVNGPYWNRGVNYTNRKTTIIKQAPGSSGTRTLKQPGPSKTFSKPNTSGFLPDDINTNKSSYLSILERNVEATKNRLLQNQKDILAQKEILEQELQEYKSSPDVLVNFGIHKIERTEAIRRTQLTIQKANNQIAALDKEILQTPLAIDLAKIAFANFQSLEDSGDKDSNNEPS